MRNASKPLLLEYDVVQMSGIFSLDRVYSMCEILHDWLNLTVGIEDYGVTEDRHINPWQDFLDLVLPTQIWSCSFRLLQVLASNIRHFGASSSTWTMSLSPRRHSHWMLIRWTTSMSLSSSYSSILKLNPMQKSSLTHTGPKILRKNFLSNILKVAASVLKRIQAFVP